MDDNCIRNSRTVESGIRRPQRPAPPCMREGCGFCANPIPIRPPQAQPPMQGFSGRPTPETPQSQILPPSNRLTPGQMARETDGVGQKEPASIPANQPWRAETAYDSLAMGYVPLQRWGQTYPPAQGIGRGTIFPDLDRPFWIRCGRQMGYPQGALPVDTLTRGTLPSGTLPVDILTRGTSPSGTLPTDTLTRDSLPSGIIPTETLTRDSLPSGSLPTKRITRGQITADNEICNWEVR